MDLDVKISNWLFQYLKNNRLSCFVVGVSGGIDSALTSTLCAQTGVKTILVSLPINQKKDQLFRAEKHINWLKSKYKNVSSYTIDLTKITNDFKILFDDNTDLTIANTKSRLRMVALYHLSSNHNGIVVGTGNKIEDFGVGFFTKYGDGGVDISPIADLTKTEVRSMSKKLGIIDEILTAPPTDGLWDTDKTDEEQLGATYEELEFSMEFSGEVDKLNDRQKKVFSIYNEFNRKNKHKMIPIPIFKKNE